MRTHVGVTPCKGALLSPYDERRELPNHTNATDRKEPRRLICNDGPQKTGTIAQDEERALNKIRTNSKARAIKRIEPDAKRALLILGYALEKLWKHLFKKKKLRLN